MSPQDIHIFQVLAAAFTLSFMALCFFILRFMQGLEKGRNELIRVATRLEENWMPILDDLQAGAAQFRTTAELAREGAEKFADLGAQAARLSALTKTGARGAWTILAHAASAFLNRSHGASDD